LDVRVIAATHRDLEEMVAGGEFRKDLWFRLNVFPITVPPLRHRKEDIPAFVQYFINRKTRELNLKQRPELGAETLKRLQNYAWPGNVRELENMVERELIRCQTSDDNKLILSEGFEPLQPKFAQSPQFPANGSESTGLNLDEVNRRHILRVLDITNGKVQGKNGAAALLGLNASTLRSRMRKLCIPFGRSSA
jgi:transcriptional regulator with GAF, ATPase, and Fis domain